MATPVKKIWIWVWMTALLASTVGLSVHQIYCYCVGSTTYTLFDVSNECRGNHALTAADCCQKTAPSSCCEKPVAVQKTGKPCTQKTTKVFHLKTEFVVGHPLDKTLEAPWIIPDLPGFVFSLPATPAAALPGNKAPPEPPPPPSGRQLCIRHEVFRC